SRPSKSILSAVIFAVQGRRPMTASMDTDFPEPDSPTMAKTSPVSTFMETLSTARKKPLAVLNSTVRFLISSRGMGGSHYFHVNILELACRVALPICWPKKVIDHGTVQTTIYRC